MVKCRKFTNEPIIQGRECQLSLYRPIDLSSGFTVCNSQWSRRFHRSRSDDEDPHATDSVSLLCHLASVAKHSSLHTDVCPQIPYFCTRPQQFGLLQQSPDRLASHSHPASPVIPKCRSKAHFNLRRCEHITDALISLHWLRVPERIIFKVATLMYRALHVSAPPYLASSFTCVANMPHRRRLRSASNEQLDVPTCRRSTIGGRAFPVAGAKVWNGLPSDVTSLSVFKNRLKTYFFCCCYETVWL